MSASKFSLELKERFSERIWSSLILSLRQDVIVWDALSQTSLGDQALEILPAKVDQWSPASLSLLALDHIEQLETLRSSPLQPLDQSILDTAEIEYWNWVEKKIETLTLSKTGYIALALRERYRLSGSWRDVLQVLKNQLLSSETVLTCLYGLIPDPFEFLRSISELQMGAVHTDYIIHILLSNPLTSDAQDGLFGALLSELPLDKNLQILNKLSMLRPWQATQLTRDLVPRIEKDNSQLLVNDIDEICHLGQQFDNLADRVRLAQIYQLASQPDDSVSILAETIKTFRRLRGHLSAQLAQAITFTRQAGKGDWQDAAQETGLEAWKQAIKLVPDCDEYSAGLAKTLADVGSLSDANDYLQAKGLSKNSDQSPALLLAHALIAERLEAQGKAEKLAEQAYSNLGKGNSLSRQEFTDLARLLDGADLYQKVIEVTDYALQVFPTDQQLLELQAAAYTKLHQPEKALSSIFASLAANNCLSDAGDEKSSSATNLRKLLVQNLEAVEAWKSALKERLELLALQEAPEIEDFYRLAVCASRADEPDQAAAACERVLEIEPDNLQAHRLIADALQELGDFELALEHYNNAIQLAPDKSENWIALAKFYQSTNHQVEVVDTLRTACQAVPDDSLIHLSLGEAYLTQKMPTQALSSLKRAYRLSSDERIALRLGQTLLELGHLEDAQQVLQKAYDNVEQPFEDVDKEEQVPSEGELELAYAYGRSLLGVGELSQAISILGTVVRNRPEDLAPCLDLARALLRLNDQPAGSQRAVPFLNCILAFEEEKQESSLETDHLFDLEELKAEAHVLLAEAYANLGDLKQSMTTYRQALEIPKNQNSDRRTRISLGLGKVALRLDQPETAVAALQEAAKTEPLNAAAQRSLSEAFLASGLAPESFQAACAALELKPSDLGMLTWFADHGKKLGLVSSSKNLPVQEEVVRALKVATQIAPERADLWGRLGEILSEAGQQSEALKVYRKLVDVYENDSFISVSDMCKSSKIIRKLGDAQLAASILHKGIDHLNSKPFPKGIDQVDILADLYSELAFTHRQMGDSDAALSALEHALKMDANNLDYLMHKVDLLFDVGEYKAAFESLKNALRLDPLNAELHHRMAIVLQLIGYLPAALSHAQQALEILEEADSPLSESNSRVRLLAAELSYLLLQPEQAEAYLQREGLQVEAANTMFRKASLQAEMALEKGDKDKAEREIRKIREVDPDHPRCRAARSLLSCLNGNCKESEELFRSIFGDLEKGQNGGFRERGNIDRLEEVLTLLSVNKLAISLGMWKEAIALTDNLIEKNPHEPLSYLRRSQVLVLRAEAQRLCQDFAIRSHMVDAEALSEDASEQFDKAIQSVEQKIANASSPKQNGSENWWDDEADRLFELWKSRGRLAFHPDHRSAGDFKKVLKALKPSSDDVAALMMALRFSGDYESAVTLMQLDWHPDLVGTEIAGHPLILTQLALALFDAKPEQALEIANDALERVLNLNSIQWPQPPMLNYLLAKIAFRLSKNEVALEFIQNAIGDWEDEPMWHTLAAEIFLTIDPSTNLPDPEKALYHLARAADLMPEYAPNHLSLGRAYIEQGKMELAVESLEKASQLEPENGETWLLLARSHHLNGETEQAAFCADRSIDRLDDAFDARLLRCEIALAADDPENALIRIDAILKEKPGHPKALLLMSQALEKVDRPADALEALEQAMQFNENPEAMRLERLQLIRRSKGLNFALEELNQLATHNPQQPDLLALLAEWLVDAGKRDVAIQAARAALQAGQDGLSDKSLANLHLLIGQQSREAGQLDQAIYHLSEAIKNSPDELEPYLELGSAYQDRREYKQALKVYQKAIDSSKQDYRPYYFAGQVLKDNKDYLAAEAMLRRASQLAPKEVSVHRLLGAVVALNLIHNRRLAPKES
jgi:tetratricopeptide (TPR) repeat protein